MIRWLNMNEGRHDLTLFGILVYRQNKTKQTNKQNKQKINKHLILTRLDTVQFLSNIYH
jgi:hypothetical protein